MEENYADGSSPPTSPPLSPLPPPPLSLRRGNFPYFSSDVMGVHQSSCRDTPVSGKDVIMHHLSCMTYTMDEGLFLAYSHKSPLLGIINFPPLSGYEPSGAFPSSSFRWNLLAWYGSVNQKRNSIFIFQLLTSSFSAVRKALQARESISSIFFDQEGVATKEMREEVLLIQHDNTVCSWRRRSLTHANCQIELGPAVLPGKIRFDRGECSRNYRPDTFLVLGIIYFPLKPYRCRQMCAVESRGQLLVFILNGKWEDGWRDRSRDTRFLLL